MQNRQHLIFFIEQNLFTSFNFSLDLNLDTSSRVVNGVFCISTALISSSVTCPVGGADPLFNDASGDAPLVGTLLFVDKAGSSSTDFLLPGSQMKSSNEEDWGGGGGGDPYLYNNNFNNKIKT